MRWSHLPAIGPVICLVLVGGCTAGEQAGVQVSAAPSPPAPPAGLVDVAVFESAGIQATRVVPDLGGEVELDVRGYALDLVAAGDVLVSTTYDQRHGLAGLARSSDLGGSWDAVELPGAPADASGLLRDAGDLITLVDDEQAWVSRDGVAWRGGPVSVGSDGFLLASPSNCPTAGWWLGSSQHPTATG